jgi:hypothetical protein
MKFAYSRQPNGNSVSIQLTVNYAITVLIVQPPRSPVLFRTCITEQRLCYCAYGNIILLAVSFPESWTRGFFYLNNFRSLLRSLHEATPRKRILSCPLWLMHSTSRDTTHSSVSDSFLRQRPVLHQGCGLAHFLLSIHWITLSSSIYNTLVQSHNILIIV